MSEERRRALCELTGRDDLLFLDGFDEAIAGVAMRPVRPVVLYDWEKCVEVLMKRDGMESDEAEEFLHFNTFGGWVGEDTPAYIQRLETE